MENKEQTGMSLEDASKEYAEGKSSSSVFQEAHIEDFKAGAEWQSSQPINSEPKSYDIDFKGQIACRIKVIGDTIEIVGAMDGYGNGIAVSDINITLTP